jgi:hypothetical protein
LSTRPFFACSTFRCQRGLSASTRLVDICAVVFYATFSFCATHRYLLDVYVALTMSMSSAIQLGDDEDGLLLFQAMASISQSNFAAAQVLDDDSVEKLSSGKVTKYVDLM